MSASRRRSLSTVGVAQPSARSSAVHPAASGAYQVTADGVEIVAEGRDQSAFERWLVKATTDTKFCSRVGDGAGRRSYGAATGDLGVTSRAPRSTAEERRGAGAPPRRLRSTNDAELADAMAEQAVVEIDYEAAAAATKGVAGTPQSVREDLVGRQFGSAVLDAPSRRYEMWMMMVSTSSI